MAGSKKKALILSGGGARGAYQAGVFRYLQEQDYHPDVICGTSVGAINAVGIASGRTSEQIVQLWKKIEARKIMHISFWKYFKDIIRRKFTPVADPTPLRLLLNEQMQYSHLQQPDAPQVYISAVNILTSEVRYFTNAEITMDHVMASASIPLVFPWQMIDGTPYWDGGIMANTPILPAIEQEVDEIIVVFLSPVGGISLDLPQNRMQALERVVELSLIGSYQNLKLKLANSNKSTGRFAGFLFSRHKEIKVLSIGPQTSLGIKSVLNFSAEQADSLIQRGYDDARIQLETQQWNP